MASYKSLQDQRKLKLTLIHNSMLEVWFTNNRCEFQTPLYFNFAGNKLLNDCLLHKKNFVLTSGKLVVKISLK
jgi:hypothetical protein